MCEHTLPQLALMEAACQREQAAGMLQFMQAVRAGAAAVISKEGHRHFLQMQTQLLDAVGLNGTAPVAKSRNRKAMANAVATLRT